MRTLHRHELMGRGTKSPTSWQPYASVSVASPTRPRTTSTKEAADDMLSNGRATPAEHASSPMRRPTAAQRHAREWHEQQASATAAAAAAAHATASPPRQLLERARGRACACSPSTVEHRAQTAAAASTAAAATAALTSSAACGAFQRAASRSVVPSVYPSTSDARAGMSRPVLGLGASASRGGGIGTAFGGVGASPSKGALGAHTSHVALPRMRTGPFM